jgi:AcrR family transcriptional regulator
MTNTTSSKVTTDRYVAILHASEKLFASKGFNTVTLEEIATIAGVSKGLVNYHFNSKVDLLEQLLVDGLQTISKKIEIIKNSDHPARIKLHEIIRIYLEYGYNRLSLIREAKLQHPNLVKSASHFQIHRAIAEEKLRLAGIIDDCITAGELRPVNSNIVANILLGAIHEQILDATFEEKPIEIDKVADEIAAMLYDGIGF